MAERVERADAGHGQAGARGKAVGGGERDPDADERARTEPDGEAVDLAPPPGDLGRPLDQREQRGRVTGPAAGRTGALLDQDRAAARGADGGVRGRRVEADDREVGCDRLSQRS